MRVLTLGMLVDTSSGRAARALAALRRPLRRIARDDRVTLALPRRAWSSCRNRLTSIASKHTSSPGGSFGSLSLGVFSWAARVITARVGARLTRVRRALQVTRVAQRSGILHALAEIGSVGQRDATRVGAQSFRFSLEELGTTYIKLGQLLASRPDLLPDVYIEELERLVDEVTPVPFAELEAIIHADLGDSVFASIDPEPLAAASIAQTHRALLLSGREVVVKVRRPGLVEQVELDLSVLRSTARLLARRSETARLLQIEALVDELELHLRAELDFTEEAYNAELI